MKKSIIVLGFIVLSLGALAGCALEEAGTAAPAEEAPALKTPEDATAETSRIFPQRKAEVTGVVQSIIGNEVTVGLYAPASASDGSSGTNPEAEELTEEEKAARQDENKASGGGGTGDGAGSTREVVLSGESLTLLIPVGTPVYQSSEATGEPVGIEIIDISQGASVKIWLLEGETPDPGLAEFVQVVN